MAALPALVPGNINMLSVGVLRHGFLAPMASVQPSHNFCILNTSLLYNTATAPASPPAPDVAGAAPRRCPGRPFEVAEPPPETYQGPLRYSTLLYSSSCTANAHGLYVRTCTQYCTVFVRIGTVYCCCCCMHIGRPSETSAPSHPSSWRTPTPPELWVEEAAPRVGWAVSIAGGLPSLLPTCPSIQAPTNTTLLYCTVYCILTAL